jgi:hypothetical protein
MNIPFDPQPEPPGIPIDKELPPTIDPNPTIGKCPLCNLELKGVMGYSCGNPNCPIFARATC